MEYRQAQVQSRLVSEAGFGLLSLLLSVAITTTITLLTLHSLNTSATLLSTLKDIKERNSKQARLLSILHSTTNDIDLHPLPLYPHVHASGQITFGDQSVITLRNRNFQPKAGSNALSYLHLAGQAPFVIRPIGHSRYEICPLFSMTKSLQVRILMALTPDGYFELDSRELLSLGNSCKNVSLYKPVSSMIQNAQQNIDPGFATFVLPVAGIYTMYISTQGTLRRLSHLGKALLENQPILKDIDYLRIKASQIRDLDIFSLQTHFSIQRNTFRHDFTHHIGRSEYLHYLFSIASYEP